MGLILVGISILSTTVLLTPGQSNTNTSNSNATTAITAVICQVFNTIKNVIFILGLTLMMLGATLYSGSNLMPAQQRGGFQGYGMAMIMGGIVGVAIAVAAPFVLNTVISASNVTVNSTIISSGGTITSGAVVQQLCSGTTNGDYAGGQYASAHDYPNAIKNYAVSLSQS